MALVKCVVVDANKVDLLNEAFKDTEELSVEDVQRFVTDRGHVKFLVEGVDENQLTLINRNPKQYYFPILPRGEINRSHYFHRR